MKKLKVAPFGTTKEGKEVLCYTLENDAGLQVRILNYGMRIQSIWMKDCKGQLRNLAWGFTGMKRYEGGGCYGALVGRFANRIKNAQYTLDGKSVQLKVNDHGNYIHGNFEHSFFEINADDSCITGTYLSPDGEFGFPGNLTLKASYSLSEEGELSLNYEATTDAPTVVNITNHNYFNLDGMPEDGDSVTADEVNIYKHSLQVAASDYLESDPVCMVTGKVIPVEGNAFDFRSLREIGTFKYDHNYCLDAYDGSLRFAALLQAAESGIAMECRTTQPGIQVYTGGKKAIALETQHFPDGPNHPEWASAALFPGETYRETTVYRFFLK